VVNWTISVLASEVVAADVSRRAAAAVATVSQ